LNCVHEVGIKVDSSNTIMLKMYLAALLPAFGTQFKR